MRAVENAKLHIGLDLENEELRQRLIAEVTTQTGGSYTSSGHATITLCVGQSGKMVRKS